MRRLLAGCAARSAAAFRLQHQHVRGYQSDAAGVAKRCSDPVQAPSAPTSAPSPSPAPAISMVSKSYGITTLRVSPSTSPEALRDELQRRASLTPLFYAGAPLVLDVSLLGDWVSADTVNRIADVAQSVGFRPVAYASTNKGLSMDQVKLPCLTASGAASSSASSQTSGSRAQAPRSSPVTRPAMVIRGRVRSGQQIYARDTSLVCLNSVSSGAEVLADGDIHVWGTLAGRAIAGLSGNREATILARQFHAELVAIADIYGVCDDHALSAPAEHATLISLGEQDQIVFESC